MLSDGVQRTGRRLIISATPVCDTHAPSAALTVVHIRFLFSEESTFEFAAVENYTQGPHNIDIAFYSTLVMIF